VIHSFLPSLEFFFILDDVQLKVRCLLSTFHDHWSLPKGESLKAILLQKTMHGMQMTLGE
jgi:hypothetical protein